MAEAKTKTINYTSEMVDRMVSMYEQLGNDGMDAIAEAVNRPVRSVRSKLVREGVYVAAPVKAKAKREEGPSKKDMLNELETLVYFDVNGLTGATKEAIGGVIELARMVAVAQLEVAQVEDQPKVDAE
jgi:hypothetical protein